MKLATILPVPFQYLEEDNDYHMCLANLVPQSGTYAEFFRRHSDRGDFVILDNGIVEGDRRPPPELVASADIVGASEVILPDEIGDADRTIELGLAAMDNMRLIGRNMMGVPQGKRVIDWERCLDEMLRWPVDTIGFSKFIDVNGLGLTRLELLTRWEDAIVDAGKEIHMLGSPGGAEELRKIHKEHPLVRGADSGHPTFCTAGNTWIRRDGRRPPGVEVNWLDPDHEWDVRLMTRNYLAWRRWSGIS